MINKIMNNLIVGAVFFIFSALLFLIIFKIQRDLFYLSLACFILIISILIIFIAAFLPVIYNAVEQIEERKNSNQKNEK